MVAFSRTKNKIVQATDQDQEGREQQNLPIDYMWALTPYASCTILAFHWGQSQKDAFRGRD